MPPGRRLWVPAILSLVLLASALAPQAAASVRQASFETAEADDSLFYAILTRTADRSAEAVQVAAQQGAQSPAAEANRTAVGNQLATFDERLVNAIEAQGTPPPELARLVEDYQALAESLQRVLGAQDSLAQSLDALPEDALAPDEEVPPQVSADPLEEALSALERERAGLADLEQAARALTDYGVEPDEAASAVDAREDRLQTVGERLVHELARLDLPRFLTIEPDRRQVEIGGTLGVSGLALASGEPAREAIVNVTLGPRTVQTGVGDDGRVRTSVPIPLDFGTGTHDLTAEAHINGSTVETQPVPVEVQPLSPSLSITPTTTVLDERTPLRVDGQLATGPLDEDGRNVTLLLDDQPAANATAGPDGAFTTQVPTTLADGGQTTLQARLTPGDDRLADARSPPIEVFIPGEPDEALEPAAVGAAGDDDQTLIGLGGGEPVFTPFDFPSAGLGPIVDLLAGLIGLGLLVLVGHALASGRDGLSVRALKRWTTFGTLTRFTPVTQEEVLAAHPRNAFPPDELASTRAADDVPPGAVFAAFVHGLREFEDDLPPGVTHRELARKLHEEDGLPRSQLGYAARLFEQAQYARAGTNGGSERAAEQLDPETRRKLLDAFTTVWEAYVDEHVDDPEDTSSWLPKAPTWVPGAG